VATLPTFSTRHSSTGQHRTAQHCSINVTAGGYGEKKRQFGYNVIRCSSTGSWEERRKKHKIAVYAYCAVPVFVCHHSKSHPTDTPLKKKSVKPIHYILQLCQVSIKILMGCQRYIAGDISSQTTLPEPKKKSRRKKPIVPNHTLARALNQLLLGTTVTFLFYVLLCGLLKS
jgi:hypothetical protein